MIYKFLSWRGEGLLFENWHWGEYESIFTHTYIFCCFYDNVKQTKIDFSSNTLLFSLYFVFFWYLIMWEFCNTLSLMPLNNTSLLNRNNIRKRNFRLYRQIAYHIFIPFENSFENKWQNMTMLKFIWWCVKC